MQSTTDSAALDSSKDFHFQYSTIKGYFLQSEDDTDSSKFDFIKEKFGLISQKYETDSEAGKGQQLLWKRFERYVRHLNDNGNSKVQYKVLFLGRHGQGLHNVAETKYGTPAWDCYWSILDGADGVTWADAVLTDEGEQQARDVNTLWKEMLPQGIPAPETYYMSPLTRTIQTADLSFQGLEVPENRPYKPLIKELVREALGVHTCDRRSPASHVLKTFPHVTLEPGFSEADLLWMEDYREPDTARRYRLAQFLDDVFAHDAGVFLSFTSHSGAIASILEAIGHRKFGLQTGGVIPVFVKAEWVEGKRQKPPHEPSAAPPACKEPPVAL